MNIFDGLQGYADQVKGYANQAYSAATDAATAVAGAAGVAANTLYNHVSPYLPGQPTAKTDLAAPAVKPPGHYMNAAELAAAKAQAEVEDVEDSEIDEESVDDDADSHAINPDAQGQAQQQHADGWSPYKVLPKAGTTLGTAFEYLRKDFQYTLEGKMNAHLGKLKGLEGENNLLDGILSKILEKSEAQQDTQKGGFDCTDDAELTQLLENGRNAGLNIPNKTQFTKSEKDLLIRELERKGRELEKKLKEQAQAIDEAKTMTNQIMEMLKALSDKINSLLSKISQAIKGKAS